SGYGLTFGKPAQQQAEADDYLGRPSDSESEERVPSKPRPDLFSSAIRGFKRITPGGPSLRPSQLSLRRTAEAHAPPLERSAASAPLLQGQLRPPLTQHARSLSLQDSLAKPLPEPPPPTLSPTSPLSPLALQGPSQSLATAFDTEDQQRNDSRPGTMESASSMEMSGTLYPRGQFGQVQDVSYNSSQSSLQDGQDDRSDHLTPKSTGPMSAGPSPSIGQSRTQTGGTAVGTATPSAHLSGLMCNVHRTTGREPHPLVGATTTILGDKLYVFGGRILSRSRPAPLTADLYELDLIRRHWTKLETSGDIPPPRYFHSMCALGDTKMVCYGGMSPTTSQKNIPQDQQPEVTVMSDIYVYDVPTRKWTFIPTQDAPQGRYAHCACVLPSSATFASHRAPLSALQHNPSTGNPNEGRIGINIDGTGGAEMVVVGGQDASNHYIEQISVFNLRSLKWVSTQPLGKSCGAYRSVVAPLPPSVTAKLGKTFPGAGRQEIGGISQEAREPGSSMLIYSNYNFLDVKLELQIRSPDGHLTERAMSGTYSPPGLRFPNGGVIDTHFVVSGTYLTSSKQEYALWALDLRTLTWSRIDAGGAVFSQGSWNRGVLWNRRNTFVVLGNRKRSLVDDYNHRRINFSNVCMVELEAFGFYDNPRKTAPLSGFVSASSPYTGPGLSLARKAGFTAGGRFHSRAAEELGEKALVLRELADMDILCIGGERIPVNSRIVARRWGPYFVQLLREGTATQDGSDAATLRSNSVSGPSGSIRASSSKSSNNSMMAAPSGGTVAAAVDPAAINTAPTPRTLAPNSRPRCLYLPHTFLTVQALLHFVYTSSLPAPSSPLCTPQILCSLLQIARPYRVDGLVEAVVERLHGLLDSRNAAAVFNATAMAAGGGRGIDGSLNPNFFPVAAGLDGLGGGGGGEGPVTGAGGSRSVAGSETGADGTGSGSGTGSGGAGGKNKLKISTAGLPRPGSDEPLSATSASDMSGSEWSASEFGDSERGGSGREVWGGDLSSVIGLQKRGLRGLMEGRRMRERTGTGTGTGAEMAGGGGGVGAGVGVGIAGPGPQGPQYGQGRVGLGIAG
ncbi:galactose oxidase, partial [Parathielavia hyrcaniae]